MSRATCSYCYEYGHNKMGCPKAKERANDPENGDGIFSPLQQWDLYCAETETNPNHTGGLTWRVRQKYDWNWKTQEAVEIQIAKRYRSRKVKRCNYCGESGHNRRTCPAIKFHKALVHQANTNYRKLVAAKLNEIGLGIGAVFTGKTKEWDNNAGEYIYTDQIGLVAGIDQSMFNLFNEGLPGDSVQTSKITIKFNNGQSKRYNVPKCFSNQVANIMTVEYWDDTELRLLAPASFKASEAWLNNEDIAKHIDAVFKDKEINQHSYNDAHYLTRYVDDGVETKYEKS